MKLNAELFDVARFSDVFGIPVLAAVPVVSSILDTTLDAPCQWYRLAPDSQDVSDIELTLASDGVFNNTIVPDIVTGPLKAEDLVAIVHEAARPVTWDVGIQNLREIRSSTKAERGTGKFPYFGGYKPFNIMATER